MPPLHLRMIIATSALAGSIVAAGCTADDARVERECQAAAENFLDVLVAAEPAVKQVDRSDFAELETALVTSCHETRWSRAARRCIRSATDETELRACEKRWSAGQRAELKLEIAAISDDLDRNKVTRIGRRMDQIRDAICQCSDASCADRGLATLEAYTRSLKFWTPDVDRDEYAARMTAYRDEIATCAHAARGS